MVTDPHEIDSFEDVKIGHIAATMVGESSGPAIRFCLLQEVISMSSSKTLVLSVACLLTLSFWNPPFAEEARRHPLAGADETTPSRSHYFSWINNTNEGSTEAQTLANLDFFKWMHDEYGMELDIYAFDAGVIDAPRYYGSITSDRFKENFPNGLDPIYEKAKSFGCRLGVWLGPDGFGDTPEEEKTRTEMLVKLCRDYDFHLFKVDAVCGQLRDEKQKAFVNMLIKCRKFCPDLIVLNHRLNLGDGVPYVTTKLWGGEAYIDVWRSNRSAATHNRACTVTLGIPRSERTDNLGVCSKITAFAYRHNSTTGKTTCSYKPFRET